MLGPREIYRRIKTYKQSKRIHPTRRVDKVAPIPGKRVAAITFDDGPCAGPAKPGSEPVTESILKILSDYRAKGTFDIIGTTAPKYPDIKGENGGPYWNGVKYDHYPEFRADNLAGAVNQPDLVKQIVQEGHELSNHGFTHAPFGPCRYPYASRKYLSGYDAVLWELESLHQLVFQETGYRMRLGRPAHYIDKTSDGRDAYDAYRAMRYIYLGASFDGGGWMASAGSFSRDVDDMVKPMEALLAEDPDSLNGAIIFHKDGYNMSAKCPAVRGLGRQLELLSKYQYDIVTVSELCSMSQFTDIGPGHPLYKPAESLLKSGYVVTYADNCVRPEEKLTVKQLDRMCLPVVFHKIYGEDFLWISQAVSQKVKDTRLSFENLVSMCNECLEQNYMDSDERRRRLQLLAYLKPSLTGKSIRHSPVNRGDAIRILAAAFTGV